MRLPLRSEVKKVLRYVKRTYVRLAPMVSLAKRGSWRKFGYFGFVFRSGLAFALGV